MLIEQLSVFIENRRGRLADIMAQIAEKNINIIALSVADTSDFGIVRFIADNPDAAISLLTQSGLTVSLATVISVSVPDVPGGLAGALKLLAGNDINVDYMYGYAVKDSSEANMVMRVDDPKGADELLKSYK